MSRKGQWQMVREGEAVTLRRRGAKVWDLDASTHLPLARRSVVAHEVRKDLWRLLRDLRGFAPMVSVTAQNDGLSVRAGGSVHQPHWPKTQCEAILHDMLNDPHLRHRWVTHGRLR